MTLHSSLVVSSTCQLPAQISQIFIYQNKSQIFPFLTDEVSSVGVVLVPPGYFLEGRDDVVSPLHSQSEAVPCECEAGDFRTTTNSLYTYHQL